MSIQIIDEIREPSRGEKFGNAIRGGTNLLAQFFGAQKQKEQQQQQYQQENEAIKSLTGMDPSGIRDPKMRQRLLDLSLQGQQDSKLQQFKMQQQQAQQQSLQNQQSIVGKVLRGEKVTPDERDSLPPNVQLALDKAMSPKSAPGGLTGQPTPPNVASSIENILDKSENMNADQLQVALDKAGVPRAFSNSAVETRRRQDETKAKNVLEEQRTDYQSFKDNKEYTEKVLGGLEAYKRDKMVLDQMDKIASKGNLPKPLGVSLLNKLGIPLGTLENPDAEQFDKLSQELMKNIQGTYGSRILQTEVQNFMRSIPTLLNSSEGQKKLITQWKILNEGKKIYYDAYKEIRKQNPKRLPPDLHEQVLEQAESKLDLLSEQFKRMNTSKTQMRTPDGSMIDVPEEDIEEAMSLGAERI